MLRFDKFLTSYQMLQDQLKMQLLVMFCHRNRYYPNFPYSFNFAICMLVYSAFSSLKGEFHTYLSYMKSIQTKEEETNIDNPKIINIFCEFLSKSKTQESYNLLEKMINLNLVDSNITKGISTVYFEHYKTKEESKSYIL